MLLYVAVEVSEYKLSDKFKDLPFECSFWDVRPAVGNINVCKMHFHLGVGTRNYNVR